MEERGELLRSEAATAQPLFGNFEGNFSRDLRERAQKMTYAYCLFYCFENEVRVLVAQRLLERKGANWWEDPVPSNVRTRVENKKTEIERNKWHRATIGADINHTLFGDLSSIIIAQWQEFEELFPDQHWVQVLLNQLERSLTETICPPPKSNDRTSTLAIGYGKSHNRLLPRQVVDVLSPGISSSIRLSRSTVGKRRLPTQG